MSQEHEGLREDQLNEELGLAGPPHVYTGERCIHCGANLYDVILFGSESCIEYPGRISVWTFEEGRNDMEAQEEQEELRNSL